MHLGIHDLEHPEKGVQYVTVENITTHKDYFEHCFMNDTVSNIVPNINVDIAVLKLKKSVKFSDTIHPICLADSKPDKQSVCFFAGWGKGKCSVFFTIKLYYLFIGRNGYIPTTMHEMQVPLTNEDYCVTDSFWKSYFLSNFIDIQKTICSAGTGTGNACSVKLVFFPNF